MKRKLNSDLNPKSQKRITLEIPFIPKDVWGLILPLLQNGDFCNCVFLSKTIYKASTPYLEHREKEKRNIERVKKRGIRLRYVCEQTGEICLEAVKQNGWALEYVKEQTREICLEAVKENGLALMCVKEQTREICLEAVKRDGCALEYVEKQDKEICLEAVKRNAWALVYVKKQFRDYGKIIFKCTE